MKCEAKTEKEMRDTKVPSISTREELLEYIDSLVERKHDYGTAVYAMSMAAVAAYNYVAHKEGVTGFQASCADLDILRRNRGLLRGKILDYGNLLYPQYLNEEHFPSVEYLLTQNAGWLKKEAIKLLAMHKDAAQSVKDHWMRLAAREEVMPR